MKEAAKAPHPARDGFAPDGPHPAFGHLLPRPRAKGVALSSFGEAREKTERLEPPFCLAEEGLFL
jgi:hypothetical protein